MGVGCVRKGRKAEKLVQRVKRGNVRLPELQPEISCGGNQLQRTRPGKKGIKKGHPIHPGSPGLIGKREVPSMGDVHLR